MTYLTLLAGLALLLGGGDFLVRGAVALATRLGVSPLVIGLTLVGFGTSMPELVASIQAALIGAPGIAVGNIVGSNIANILLILGLSALILPIAATRAVLRRDGVIMFGASLVLVAVAVSGAIERWMGAALIGALAVYTIVSFVRSSRSGEASGEAADVPGWPRGLWVSLAVTLAGIAGVVVGADFLVKSAIVIARDFGLSEAVIGLTVVAIGTSLPELVTSVMAAFRRQGDVALGNIIGSNIFNILGIGGATALVTRVPIPPQIVQLDVWVMLGAAALLIVFASIGRGISRAEGAILVVCYGLYLALQFSPVLRGFIGVSWHP
ncbi:calcium/sodium antiporter [Acuticoccus sp. MNP-M23]|uniref:calcium/sodium antiporter n=1 Tax=Acuticoccus sp. MNP-M23 TaxID=3072793 RepID=UPI002815E958|nr:calcium/sodium antiporter [Acuticoccus sp. MNP-M23]WMS44162.1 calcium/sodium antiporter [Acuticoccus sp. MNP-M23]